MPVSGPLLRRLMAAGVTGDDLAEVVDMIDAEMAVASATVSAGAPRSHAARQARYRASLKGEVTESDGSSDVTSDPSLRHSPPPKSISTPPDTSLRSVSQRRCELFAELWSILPKRSGSNPKQPAEEKYYRLLKASQEPEVLAAEIADGARRFAVWAAGQDPKFNPQAMTWLNQGRWRDDYTSLFSAGRPRAPPNGSGAPRNPHLAALDAYLDREAP